MWFGAFGSVAWCAARGRVPVALHRPVAAISGPYRLFAPFGVARYSGQPQRTHHAPFMGVLPVFMRGPELALGRGL